MANLDEAASALAIVHLSGESRCGEEVGARELHRRSPRRAGPRIAVHALREDLLESALFVYEEGAFTGAVQREPGRAELGIDGA